MAATPAILSCFENVTPKGEGQWEAKCPCHDDSKNSLCIGAVGSDRTLIYCQAGCTTHNVLSAVGRTMADLFPPREAPGSRKHTAYARSGRPPAGFKIVATYDYRDEAGELLYQTVRLDPKDFRQRTPRPSGGWNWKVGDVRHVIYNLPAIAAARAAHAADPSLPAPTVYVVEGEKDADYLIKFGLLATTNVGGASKTKSGRSKWLPQYSDSLAGCDVVIVPDNDEPGKAHAIAVAVMTHGKAASVKIVNLPDLPHKGDLSDWIAIAGNTSEKFFSLTADAPLFDPSTVPAPSDPKTLPVAEEVDDPHRLARLYLTTNIIRYWRQEWYVYDGRCYSIIPESEIVASVNRFIKSEYDRAFADSPSADFARKVNRTIVSNVLAAVEGLCLIPGSVEYGTWVDLEDKSALPERRDWVSMVNGILCLDRLLAGEDDYLIPHSPAWFSPTSLPYSFDPAADCPRWSEFLSTNLEGDNERIALLQEFTGYCLLPDNSHQKFLALEGEGANGKSVYCAVLQALVGQRNVSNIPLENFGEQFDLSQTLGKLVNVAADCSEIDKTAEGKLKSFTSGDFMFFNRKGIAGVNAMPSARMVMAWNNRPRFSDRSGGLWRRMLLVPFRVQIPENRRTLGMDKPAWWEATGELPGILNWAIQGLDRLRTSGRFTYSAVSVEAISDYQEETNPARAFLVDHYETADGCKIPASEVYSAYKAWCKENGYHAMADRSFGKEVRRVHPKCDRKQERLSEGKRGWMYVGIAVRAEIIFSFEQNGSF